MDDGEYQRLVAEDISRNSTTSSISSRGQNDTRSPRTLGMFQGVIVPCILSMFSIVVFLRTGYLVGYAGIPGAFVLLAASYIIVTMTVLSLSALCTNGAIESGGAYYMISRTLGPEFGASIGLLFFIANVASCALYIFGFIEILQVNLGVAGGDIAKLLPDSYWWNFLYATCVLVICTLICIVGSEAYGKSIALTGLVVFVCLLSIMTSFFTTKPFVIHEVTSNNLTFTLNYTSWSRENWNSHFFSYDLDRITQGVEKDYIAGTLVSILNVFAVFFNGCIGVMAGVNVSGELIEPNKAIPTGTMIAVGCTLLMYSVLILFLGGTCSHKLLVSNYTILQTINLCPPLIFAGIVLVSMSSVLSNMIGASRVLYAIAKDNMFGSGNAIARALTWCTGGGSNPLGAVLTTYGLIQLFLLYSQINMIAPLVTIFFLLAYAAVDAACLALTVTSAPNFRPTFRCFNSITCCLGMIGTVFMMILVNPLYALVAFAIFITIFMAISFGGGSSKIENSYAWGHISQALIYHQVRKYLLRLDVRKNHIKYWRPQILALSRDGYKMAEDIVLANDLKKSGLLILGHIVDHEQDRSELRDTITEDYLPRWIDLVEYLNVKSFVEITRARFVREGTEQLLRLSGLGGMKPNMLLMGFLEQHEKSDTKMLDANEKVPLVPETPKTLGAADFVGIIRDTLRMDKGVVITRNLQTMERFNAGHIDVWPLEMLSGNGISDLMKDEKELELDISSLFVLQMACVLSMVHRWRRHKITPRVMLPISTEQWTNSESISEQFQRFLTDQLRIKGVKVFPVEIGNWLDGDTIKTRADNLNELIRCQQHKTVITLLYLPRPTKIEQKELDLTDEQLLLTSHQKRPRSGHLALPDKSYLDVLDTLSRNLGPLVYVHGVVDVISTDL